MGKIINMVATECKPEVEAEFNRWYDEVHIPLLFKYQGMKKVARYKLASGPDEFPAYLAIYEFDSPQAYQAYESSPELADARAEMKETWQGGGFEIKWRARYEELKTWEK